MTLKASIIAGEKLAVKTVIKWAKSHVYNVHVDEEAIWYAVFSTLPGHAMEADFNLLNVLVSNEIVYHSMPTN